MITAMEVNKMFLHPNGAPRLLRAAAALVPMFLMFAAPAMARHTAIDFGESFDPTSLPNPSGQNFGTGSDCSATATTADACLVNVTGNGSTAVELGFSINFGPGFTNVHTLFINENGIISFGAPCRESPRVLIRWACLSSRLITRSSPRLDPRWTASRTRSVFAILGHPGEIMYARGVADPIATAGLYSLSEAVKTIHVAWAGPKTAGGTPIFTQVLIYQNGSTGDFDLRIRYGADDGDSYSYGAGTLAGFWLGSAANSTNIPSPLLANNDYFFRFSGGTLQGTVSDTDADGVPDSSDNCPRKANADQADTDGDHVGNACDNCPAVANPDQRDDNNNGIGNACEVAAPKKCDVDGDKDIDAVDIDRILHSLRQQATGPLDPRDADNNNVINLIDAAKCTLRCTRFLCKVR